MASWLKAGRSSRASKDAGGEPPTRRSIGAAVRANTTAPASTAVACRCGAGSGALSTQGSGGGGATGTCIKWTSVTSSNDSAAWTWRSPSPEAAPSASPPPRPAVAVAATVAMSCVRSPSSPSGAPRPMLPVAISSTAPVNGFGEVGTGHAAVGTLLQWSPSPLTSPVVSQGRALMSSILSTTSLATTPASRPGLNEATGGTEPQGEPSRLARYLVATPVSQVPAPDLVNGGFVFGSNRSFASSSARTLRAGDLDRTGLSRSIGANVSCLATQQLAADGATVPSSYATLSHETRGGVNVTGSTQPHCSGEQLLDGGSTLEKESGGCASTADAGYGNEESMRPLSDRPLSLTDSGSAGFHPSKQSLSMLAPMQPSRRIEGVSSVGGGYGGQPSRRIEGISTVGGACGGGGGLEVAARGSRCGGLTPSSPPLRAGAARYVQQSSPPRHHRGELTSARQHARVGGPSSKVLPTWLDLKDAAGVGAPPRPSSPRSSPRTYGVRDPCRTPLDDRGFSSQGGQVPRYPRAAAAAAGAAAALPQAATSPRVSPLAGRFRSPSPGRTWRGGTSLDHYAVGKLIGKGAFGKVNVGVHKLTEELTAMKLCERKRIVEVQAKKCLMQEVSVLKRLNGHPNIIQLFEVIETSSYVVLVMEFASGGDLLRFVRQRRRLEESYARGLFKQLFDGVAHIHGLGVVHRDIKLENLLLDSFCCLKIADFGVAATVSAGQRLHEHCGTPSYMAPEIFAESGSGYEGPPVDVWSSGVVMYASLCGRVPFKGEGLPDLMRSIQRGKFPSPGHLGADALDLLHLLLVVDPSRRATVAAILAHAWLAGASNHALSNRGAPPPGAAAAAAAAAVAEVVVDRALLERAVALGISRALLEESLREGRLNHATAAYHLLAQQGVRQRGVLLSSPTAEVPPPAEASPPPAMDTDCFGTGAGRAPDSSQDLCDSPE